MVREEDSHPCEWIDITIGGARLSSGVRQGTEDLVLLLAAANGPPLPPARGSDPTTQ